MNGIHEDVNENIHVSEQCVLQRRRVEPVVNNQSLTGD